MNDFPERIAALRGAVLDDIEAVLQRHMQTTESMGIVIVFTPRELPPEDDRAMACMANVPQKIVPHMLGRALLQVNSAPDSMINHHEPLNS